MALSHELIDFARRLRIENPLLDEFSREWRSFNACYNEVAGTSERECIMNTIIEHFSEGDAASILIKSSDAIAYFSQLPPGNMRKKHTDPSFRERATTDLQIVNDSKNASVLRLAHIASVLYQLRCNLTHAGKDPFDPRDKQLIQFALPVLKSILAILLK